MSFNWQQEEKEKYFKIAESKISAAGFDDLLEVDRTCFGVTGDKKVKVFLKAFHRKGHTKRWWEAKRTMENLHEQRTIKNRFGQTEKALLIHGYMLIEMEEDDK